MSLTPGLSNQNVPAGGGVARSIASTCSRGGLRYSSAMNARSPSASTPVHSRHIAASRTPAVNGARTTGGNRYVTTSGGVAAFSSYVFLMLDDTTIVVTIGLTCSGGGCSALGQQTTNGTYSFVAAPTLTDLAGNAAATTAKTQSMRLF